MFKYPRFAIGFTSLYLLVFALFAPNDMSLSLAYFLFSFSPFLVIWMVVSVLKDTSQEVSELQSGEEWGYYDRPDIKPV